MPLSAQQMRDIAVNSYFGAVARSDRDTVAALFTDDAVMRIMSAGISYRGKPAIVEHFEDFLSIYENIAFTDFIVTADEARQRVAVQFTITLDSGNGQIVMTNCNFFQFNDAGLVEDVAIYMSDLPQEGF